MLDDAQCPRPCKHLIQQSSLITHLGHVSAMACLKSGLQSISNSGIRRRIEAASCRGVKLMEDMLYTRRLRVLGLALRRSKLGVKNAVNQVERNSKVNLKNLPTVPFSKSGMYIMGKYVFSAKKQVYRLLRRAS